ncbi:MAG: hypothetical protein SFT94_04295 [Pseudanabaenaceae cyanobacterium bins.68]|nr:hypothetical protein [Pseudanabaenaceae cyanobacterium bins.68]
MSDKIAEQVIEQSMPEIPERTISSGNLPVIELEPALLAELCEVTNNPSEAVNMAIRQWLLRRAIKETDISRPLTMNPIVPPRGEWND